MEFKQETLSESIDRILASLGRGKEPPPILDIECSEAECKFPALMKLLGEELDYDDRIIQVNLPNMAMYVGMVLIGSMRVKTIQEARDAIFLGKEPKLLADDLGFCLIGIGNLEFEPGIEDRIIREFLNDIGVYGA